MGFVLKKCPHCGRTTEYRSSHDYSDHFGSPIRLCFSCRKTYVDREYVEPALRSFEELLPSKISLLFGKGKIANILLGGGFVFGGVYFWIEDWYLNAGAAVCIILGILILIPVIKGIYKASHGISQEEFNEYKEAYLSSLIRLMNQNYIRALKNLGYNISNIVLINGNDAEIRNLYERIKESRLEKTRIIYKSANVVEHGVSLDSGAISGHPKSDNPKAGIMFCRYCGVMIPIDSTFCQNCGKALISHPNENEEKIKGLKNVSNRNFFT